MSPNPEKLDRLMNGEVSESVSRASETAAAYFSTSPDVPSATEALQAAVVSSFKRGIAQQGLSSHRNGHDPFAVAKPKQRGRPTKRPKVPLPRLDSFLNGMSLRMENTLSMRHMHVLRDMREGLSYEEISQRHGLSVAAIKNIRSLPAVREIFRREQEAVEEEFRDLAGKAVKNMRDLLDSKDEHTKKDATKFYLEKTLRSPKSEIVHEHRGEIKHNVEHDAKAKLMDKLNLSQEKIIELTSDDYNAD